MYMHLNFLQVFLFAQSTSRFTKFVMGSQEAFELYFKQTKCNEELEKLYKLEDVYNQIALIVNSVSCFSVLVYSTYAIFLAIFTYCKNRMFS